MNYIKLTLVGLALASTASIADDCVGPNPPSVPDGGSSSMEQMLAGQQAVKEFQAANIAHMECLDKKITTASTAATAKDASDEAKTALKQLEEEYNAAVSNEEEVAGQFNTEIREYKAANPG